MEPEVQKTPGKPARWHGTEILGKIDQIVLVISFLYFIAFAIKPRMFSGVSHSEDPMAISGFAMVLLVFVLARRIQNAFLTHVANLIRSGNLLTDDMGFRFRKKFEQLLFITATAVVVTLLPLTLIGIYLAPSAPDGKIHLMIGATLGGWLVASRFAWAIATGVSPMLFKRTGITVAVVAGAADQSGGLRPLGAFYFRQAIIVLIPTAFMLFWFYVIDRQLPFTDPYWHCATPFSIEGNCPSEDVRTVWSDHFIRLVGYNVIFIFSVSVFIPSFALGRNMAEYKRRYFLPLCAAIENEIRDLQNTLLPNPTDAQNLDTTLSVHNQIKLKHEALRNLRDAPVWPLPLWETVFSLVSNVSAFVGLVGFQLF